MTDRSENIYSQRNKALEILFAVLLLLLPLLKINQGVDLTDTPYSLGNYRFFEGADGVWVLATFLSNVTGYLFTRLPFGGTMIGMKLHGTVFLPFLQDEDAHVGRIPRGSGGDRLLLVSLCDPV